MDVWSNKWLSKELLEKIINLLDNVKKIDIDALKKYKRNNKKHPQEQVDNIANNIRKYGFYNPILIDENNEIIAGHWRILALKQIGIKLVPTITLSWLEEKEKVLLRIWDNKLNESPWDEEALKTEIIEFWLDDLKLETFGVELIALEFDEEEEEEDVDDKIKNEEKTIIKVVVNTPAMAEILVDSLKEQGYTDVNIL